MKQNTDHRLWVAFCTLVALFEFICCLCFLTSRSSGERVKWVIYWVGAQKCHYLCSNMYNSDLCDLTAKLTTEETSSPKPSATLLSAETLHFCASGPTGLHMNYITCPLPAHQDRKAHVGDNLTSNINISIRQTQTLLTATCSYCCSGIHSSFFYTAFTEKSYTDAANRYKVRLLEL